MSLREMQLPPPKKKDNCDTITIINIHYHSFTNTHGNIPYSIMQVYNIQIEAPWTWEDMNFCNG